MMRCERCDMVQAYDYRVELRWREQNMMQRCRYCGTPHSCAHGRPAAAITPEFTDCEDGVLSPWMDRAYRPYIAGRYECVFRGIEQPLHLDWDGRVWRWNGRVVDVTEMVKWRGTWASE